MIAADRAMFVSAGALVEDLAGLTGIDAEAIETRLCLLPENMLCLLDSPQGWTALADYVGGALGAAPFLYSPTVH